MSDAKRIAKIFKANPELLEKARAIHGNIRSRDIQDWHTLDGVIPRLNEVVNRLHELGFAFTEPRMGEIVGEAVKICNKGASNIKPKTEYENS